MASKSHASIEDRYQNGIYLYSHLLTLLKYNPTAAVLQAAKIKLLINTVITPLMTPYRDTKEIEKIARGICDAVFDTIHDLAIEIRSESFETFFGTDFYNNVNHYVRLITGENVSRYSVTHPKKEDDPATPEDESEWTSVSQLDRESRLGNFKSLISLLTAKGEYDPEDNDIKIPELQIVAVDAQAKLKDLSEKTVKATAAKTAVMIYFDGPDGLSEIAARAKRNVKRNYGKDSPEYKALVNKAY